MEIVIGPENSVAPSGGSAVTIGAYDGVHLGHRYVIGELCKLAKERNLESVVVTFDRHPATVVRPESAPPLLTGLDEKIDLLASTGVDRTLIVPFDLNRAHESAEDFVEEVLVDALDAKLVVVGEDFHFGRERKGNVQLLEQMGKERGFEVIGVKLRGDDEAVSSTRVRKSLSAGDVAGAAILLGRPHSVRGVVVHGDGRGGTELGFPTANLELPADAALPSDGIYACWYVDESGIRHMAASSLGRRPTFHSGGADRLLEAHLLDFNGDLYGQKAEVEFVSRLREEIKFSSAEALVVQMKRDVDDARAILTGQQRG